MPAGAAKGAGLRFGGGVEPGHTCYPMRWLLVAALTGCANANGCYDTCCFAPSCPGPGSDSGAPAGGLVGPAGSGGEAATRGAAVCPAGYTRKLQSCAIPCCVPDAGTNGTCCQLGRRPGPHPNGVLAVPTDVQLAWQDFEVGALNSFQMVTFWGGQLSADRPFNLSRPEEFTAQDLDTDQWAEAVVAMGAKYQVLNVKDESGFLLWPTQCKYSNGTVCACPTHTTYNVTTTKSLASASHCRISIGQTRTPSLPRRTRRRTATCCSASPPPTRSAASVPASTTWAGAISS